MSSIAEPLRVGIIGCGQIADGHAAELGHTDFGRLIAVCDRDELIAEQFSRRHQVSAHYVDVDQMLKAEKLDVVHICTPPATHLTLGTMCMDHGAHVFVEKPLAANFKEAEQLVAYARAKSRMLTIGHVYHFDPPAVAVREAVAAGKIGEVVHVEAFYGYRLEGSYGARVAKGGWVGELKGKLLKNTLNHLVDRCAEYLDPEAPLDLVVRRRPSSRVARDNDFDDDLRMQIRTGARTAFLVFSSSSDEQSLVVHGTAGKITADFLDRSVLVQKKSELPGAIGRYLGSFRLVGAALRAVFANTKLFLSTDYRYFKGLGALLDKFYLAIIEERDPPISYESILLVERLVAMAVEDDSA